MDDDGQSSRNYALFRDSLSATLLRPASKHTREPGSKRRGRRRDTTQDDPHQLQHRKEPSSTLNDDGRTDPDELADFIDYLASEIFESFPPDLQHLDHRSWRDSQALQDRYALPLTTSDLVFLDLPPAVADSLRTYSLIAPDPTLDSPLPATPEAFLLPVLTDYVAALTAPPPASYATRADECEICGRDWIPLSYHHLIPRFVHDKAVKRGWHQKEDLQNVAWLCGACHRFVHQFKGHEELARDYYTVELLMEEEEVRKWAAWAGKLRWKGR